MPLMWDGFSLDVIAGVMLSKLNLYTSCEVTVALYTWILHAVLVLAFRS